MLIAGSVWTAWRFYWCSHYFLCSYWSAEIYSFILNLYWTAKSHFAILYFGVNQKYKSTAVIYDIYISNVMVNGHRKAINCLSNKLLLIMINQWTPWIGKKIFYCHSPTQTYELEWQGYWCNPPTHNCLQYSERLAR